MHAGQIKEFIGNWALLTQDPWVLQTVQGFQLLLVSQPVQGSAPSQIHLSQVQQTLVSTEIQTLIEKQAIPMVQPGQGGFVSQIFLVPKKDGGFHPVINLKALNKFIAEEHFKMEGFHMVKDLAKPGLTKLDQARPKGCLLSGAHRPQSPKISPVSMVRGNIPVLLPPIWPILCPSHLHEVDETSSGFSEGERNQTNHISGRPVVPGQLLEYPTQPNGVCQGLISDSGFDHQRQEIPNGTGVGDSFSGSDSVNISNASVIT